MIRGRGRIEIILLVLLQTCFAKAQTNVQSETGIVPFGSYHSGDVDSVDLKNGNLSIQIPLFSIPQKGKLSLSYSLVFNSPQYALAENCDDPNYCYPQYQINSVFGAQLVLDQAVNMAVSVAPPPPYGQAPGTNSYTLQVSNEGTHQMVWDDSDPNLRTLRAADGSGYTYLGISTAQLYNFGPWDASIGGANCFYLGLPGTVLTPSGVNHTVQLNSNNCTSGNPVTTSETDLSGNVLLYNSYFNTFGSSEPGAVTNGGGTVIVPDFYQAPSSTDSSYISAHCPNLGNSAQPVYSVTTWTVPGPNGNSSTYYFCMTGITANTGFGNPVNAGWTELGSGNFAYEEAYGGAYGIQSVVLPNGQYWGFIYDTQPAPSDWDGDQSILPVEYGDLTELIYPTGGNIQYSYQTLYGCSNDDSSWEFVQHRTLSDGGYVSGTWNYGWSSGATGDLTTVTDPYENDTVHTFSSPSDSGSCYTLQETQTQKFTGSQSNNQVLQTIIRTFGIAGYIAPSGTNAYVPINAEPTQIATTGAQAGTQTPAYSYLFTGSSIFTGGTSSTAHENYYFESPTTTVTQDPLGTTIGTKNVYQWQADSTAASDNFITGLSSTCTMSGNPSSCGTWSGGSFTSYGYDGNYNQNTVSQWVNTTGTWNTTTTQYYSWGEPETVTDPRNLRVKQIQYDGSGIFPQSITNALNQVDQYTYDDITGNMLSHTSANNNTTTYQYNDPLGRLTKVTYPPTYSGQNGTVTTSYYDAGRTVTTTTTASPNPSQVSSQVYDGLGRVIQKQQSAGSTQTTYTDTTYDEMGRVASVSNPYYSPGGPMYGITSYAYDALGRTTMLCEPDNNIGTPVPCIAGSSYQQWIYSGNAVDFYDELRNHWQRGYDVFGRLVKVLEPNSSNVPSLETDYQYDPLGNLVQVVQWGGSYGSSGALSRSFTYDSVSRLICASNPENSSASCPSTASSSYTAGTAGYSYDGDGNVLTKTSPAVNSSSGSQTIGYSYDGLNRLCYKVSGIATPSQYSGSCPSTGPTNVIELYGYDSSSVSGAQNTVGRVTDERSYAGGSLVSERQPYSYDALGRLGFENQCVLGSCSTSTMTFHPAFTFDLAGNLLTLTDGTTPNPTAAGSILTFTNAYDSGGRLQSVTSNWSDSTHPATLFQAQSGPGSPPCGSSATSSYSPFGGLMNATFGSSTYDTGISLNRIYDIRGRTSCEGDTGGAISNATAGSGAVIIVGSEQVQ